MTALERIKELTKFVNEEVICHDIDINDGIFLTKAFNVMRTLAKEKLEGDCGWMGDLDGYFEDRMSAGEGK